MGQTLGRQMWCRIGGRRSGRLPGERRNLGLRLCTTRDNSAQYRSIAMRGTCDTVPTA